MLSTPDLIKGMDEGECLNVNISKLMNQTKTEWKRSKPIRTYSKASPPMNDTKSRYGRSHKPRLSCDFVSTDRKVSQILKVDFDNQMHYFKSTPCNSYRVSKAVMNTPSSSGSGKTKGRPRKLVMEMGAKSDPGPQIQTRLPLARKPFPKELKDRELQAPAPTSTETIPLPLELQLKMEPPDIDDDVDDELQTDDLVIGDLAWACVGGFPYWPCAVTKDPFEHVYTKLKFLGRGKTGKEYIHVRFFGDNGRRSWVVKNNTMPYLGIDHFQAMVVQFSTPHYKKTDLKLFKAFTVGASVRKPWQAAVSEAESLRESPRSERLQYFVNLYPVAPNKFNTSVIITPEKRVTEIEPTTPLLKRKHEHVEENGAAFASAEELPETKRPKVKHVSSMSPTKSSVPLANQSCITETPKNKIITKRRRSSHGFLAQVIKQETVSSESASLSDADTQIKEIKTELEQQQNKSLDASTNLPRVRRKSDALKRTQASKPRSSVKKEDNEYEYFPYKKSYNKSLRDKGSKENRKSSKPTKEEKKSKKYPSGFETFSEKHYDRISDENPHLSNDDVVKYLEKMWLEMSDLQKSRYRSRLAEDQGKEVYEDESRSQSPQPVVISNSKAIKRGWTLFSGVKTDKVCHICLKGGKIVKCRGPCALPLHVECSVLPRHQAFVTSPQPKEERLKKRGRKRKYKLDDKEEANEKKEEEPEANEKKEEEPEANEKKEEEPKENKEVESNMIKEDIKQIKEEDPKETDKEIKEDKEEVSKANKDKQSNGKESKENKNEEPIENKEEDCKASVEKEPKENKEEELKADKKEESKDKVEEKPKETTEELETDEEEASKDNKEEKPKKNAEELNTDKEEASKGNEEEKPEKSIEELKANKEKANGDSQESDMAEKEIVITSEEEVKVESISCHLNSDETTVLNGEVGCDTVNICLAATELSNNLEVDKLSVNNTDFKTELGDKENKKGTQDVKNKGEQTYNGNESNKMEVEVTTGLPTPPPEMEKLGETEPSEKPISEVSEEYSDSGSSSASCMKKGNKNDSNDEKKKGWMCKLCKEGKDGPCFVCGKESGKVYKCCTSHCGKVYHEECLLSWPQTQVSTSSKSKLVFHCPQHACHTCISDNPSANPLRYLNDKLVRCVRCPTSYHYGNYCIPAGSEILSSTQIMCPKHYVHEKKSLAHVNAAWCFLCASGGSLICCDLCPNSFHLECLKISPPDGSFICEDCETGRYPLYGEIVWVKLGVYRWWPAKILFPQEIPDNIRMLKHKLGEFAVEFYGSHDYYWVNRGRVFLYHEGDSSESIVKNRTDKLFMKGVAEASEAFNKLILERADREASRPLQKPPKYIKIQVNKPYSSVKNIELDSNSITPCECDPKQDNPCGPDSNCLNRLLLVECNPEICPAGEKCCNQNFEKRLYPPLVPYKTETRGWGLKTLVPLKKGDFVIEYVGEIIDEEEYQRRLEQMQKTKSENYYFLTIDKDRMLDAGPKGNMASST
ncbi:histone-lysine N-methyltransferase NSD2 isoform X2 [Cimex lectularius]|uniref:Histone-lysine N-methyltransferase n=1 Tax=Cimex lectularius TaxID=79782 RepID=A0A8I6TME7_CIMLE|nr:histone-lysine N-methyltransferase NSD2 isoform X2 [Cimex lectularius]